MDRFENIARDGGRLDPLKSQPRAGGELRLDRRDSRSSLGMRPRVVR
jgi:hypothetical protein